MTGEGLRQSHFGSGYDAGKALLEAENQRLKEVVKVARLYRGAVLVATAHQSDCLDSPCDECDQRSHAEGEAESRLFAALARLDTAQDPHTAPTALSPADVPSESAVAEQA